MPTPYRGPKTSIEPAFPKGTRVEIVEGSGLVFAGVDSVDGCRATVQRAAGAGYVEIRFDPGVVAAVAIVPERALRRIEGGG